MGAASAVARRLAEMLGLEPCRRRWRLRCLRRDHRLVLVSRPPTVAVAAVVVSAVVVGAGSVVVVVVAVLGLLGPAYRHELAISVAPTERNVTGRDPRKRHGPVFRSIVAFVGAREAIVLGLVVKRDVPVAIPVVVQRDGAPVARRVSPVVECHEARASMAAAVACVVEGSVITYVGGRGTRVLATCCRWSCLGWAAMWLIIIVLGDIRRVVASLLQATTTTTTTAIQVVLQLTGALPVAMLGIVAHVRPVVIALLARPDGKLGAEGLPGNGTAEVAC